MRRRNLLAAAAAALATVAAGAAVAMPASADTNVLTNGGFETGNLSGWSCDATASVVSGQARTGTYALAGGANHSSNARCRQTVTVLPSTAYTLSAHVKGSYIYLGVDGGASIWTPGTGGAYRQLSLNFTTGGSQASVTIYLHGWYAQGTYYADDVALLGPGGGDPTPSPTASPSPSTSPSPSPSPSPTVSPTSSPTPTPTPTGPPPGGGPLPKHALIGYWHNFINGSTALRLRDVASAYDLIVIAFAEATSTPGAVTFSIDPGLSSALGGYTSADFKADVAWMHARGKKVIISVGGEKGRVSVGNATAAANFASSVHNLITTFGFDGVDIDLENGLNPDAMGSALRQLSNRVGPDLVITLAPQTIDMQSTGGSYFRLALNISDILTVVHTQYYNSGAMLGCDNNQPYSQGTLNFIVALACIQLENGLRPDQVALGLPASASAAGGGYVSPSVINDALDCLALGTNCGSFRPPRTYPSIRGVMTWSINWDRHSGSTFSNTVEPHLNGLP